MTLEADVVASLGRQAGRIDNGVDDVPVGCVQVVGQSHVLGAGAVAALAAGALGQLVGEDVRRAVGVGARRHERVGVVAEQALAGDRSCDAVVMRVVVARRHAPALRLRVPHQRQLEELARRRAVQVPAGVFAGADDPRDRLLEDVDLAALVIQLVAPKDVPLVPAEHLIMPPRRLVEVVAVLEVLDHGAVAGAREGPCHPDRLVAAIDLPVTAGALAIGDVLTGRGRPVSQCLDRRWWRQHRGDSAGDGPRFAVPGHSSTIPARDRQSVWDRPRERKRSQ